MEYFDPKKLSHHRVDIDKVLKYVQAMKDGAVFPPIQVVSGYRGHLKVMDGAHRTSACKVLGRKVRGFKIIK